MKSETQNMKIKMNERSAMMFVAILMMAAFAPMGVEAASGYGRWEDGDTYSSATGQYSEWLSDYYNSNGVVISQGSKPGSVYWTLPVGVSSSMYDCVDTRLEFVYNTDGYSGGDLYFYKWGSGWSHIHSIPSKTTTSTGTSSWVTGDTVDSSGLVAVNVDVAAGEEFDVDKLRIEWRAKTSSISSIYPTVDVTYPSNKHAWTNDHVAASFSTTAACGADTWYYKFSTGSTAPSSGYSSASGSSMTDWPTACGRNYLHVYFVDKAGRNSGIWSSSSHVTSYDDCDPTASLNDPGSQWYTSAPTLSWSGSDAHSGLASSPFTIQVNGKTVGTYSSSTTSLPGSSYSNRLTCGSNTIKLTVKDAASPQNSDSDSETLKFDNCAPTSPGAPNLNTNWVNEDGKPTISWNASTDNHSGIDYYEINVGSAGWVSTGLSTSYTPSTSLSTGAHTIEIRVFDKAGNTNASINATLYIDTTGPSISSVTSSSHSSSTWSNSNSVRVSSSATDTHAGMESVYFFLSNQSSGVADSTILSANYAYTCSGSSSCSSSYTLTAPPGSTGTYYAYALAGDGAETMSGSPDPNYANSIRSGALLIDMVSPNMTTTPSVQNLVNGYHGNGAVTINLGTALDKSPGSGVASFRYYLKDVSSSTTPAYQTISASSQTATWSTSLTHGTTYVACVQPVDGAGNVGNTQCSSSFTADLSTPTLDTSVVDESGNNLTNSQTYWFANTQSVDFTWMASATSGISAVKFQYKLQSNPVWPNSWTIFATSSGSGTQSLPTLSDGIYDLRIQAVNALGSTTTNAHIIKIDTNAPHSVSLFEPNGWRNSSSVIMNWSAMDSTAGLASIGLYDAVSQSAVSLCGAGGNQLCNTTLSSPATASGSFALTLSTGTHSFYIVACDSVGHCTTTSLSAATAKVDLTTPSCALEVSPAHWTSNNPTINHTVQDGGAISGITTAYAWTFMGNVLDSGNSFQNGYTMTGSSDGVQTFTLTVQNGAGTTSTCVVNAFVDKTEPQTPVISGIQSSPDRYEHGLLLNISIHDQTSGPSEVDIFINGNHRRTISNFNANQTKILYIEEYISSVELVDGEHNLSVTVTDQAGNSRTTLTTFVVDRTSPIVSYFSSVNKVLPNHQFGHDGALLKWLVEEERSEPSVDLYVDGMPYATNLGGNEQQFQLNLQTGTYDLELRGSDGAGNAFTSDVLTLSFLVDNDAPQLTCAANGDLAMLESSDNTIAELRYMQCEFDDASAINTEPEAYVDGALVIWDEYGSISEGITFADDLGTGTGTYNFLVKVADVHGNTAEFAFNLDITGPELEVFFSAEPTTAGEQTVNFYVQGGDANSREYVSFKLNGVDVDISQSSSNTNLAVPLMLSPGEHEFEITVSDQFNTVTRILSAQVACQLGTYWNDDEAMACEPLPTDPCESSPSILRLIDASPIYYVQLTSDIDSSEFEISLNGESLDNHMLSVETNQLVLDFSNTTSSSGKLTVKISMDGVECSVSSFDLQFSGDEDGTTTNDDDQPSADGIQEGTKGGQEGLPFGFWIAIIGLILGMLVLGAFVLSRGESVDPT